MKLCAMEALLLSMLYSVIAAQSVLASQQQPGSGHTPEQAAVRSVPQTYCLTECGRAVELSCFCPSLLGTSALCYARCPWRRPAVGHQPVMRSSPHPCQTRASPQSPCHLL
jgi:hypothetical protein